MMFGAVPPVPIAAFGDQQLFVCQLLLFRSRRRRTMRIEISRFGEVVPREIVLRRSDPDIEVGIDPRAWDQAGERSGIACSLDRFRHRERLDLRFGSDGGVQTPKELAS